MMEVCEPGEYCEVCGISARLGTLTLRDIWHITLCVWCREDEAKFKEWLTRQIEEAVEASPDYEKQPDGKWLFVGASSGASSPSSGESGTGKINYE